MTEPSEEPVSMKGETMTEPSEEPVSMKGETMTDIDDTNPATPAKHVTDKGERFDNTSPDTSLFNIEVHDDRYFIQGVKDGEAIAFEQPRPFMDIKHPATYLKGAIDLLSLLPEGTKCVISSKSEYLVNAANSLDQWEAREWKTTEGKPLKNQDMLKSLKRLIDSRQVMFVHRRGLFTKAEVSEIKWEPIGHDSDSSDQTKLS